MQLNWATCLRRSKMFKFTYNYSSHPSHHVFRGLELKNRCANLARPLPVTEWGVDLLPINLTHTKLGQVSLTKT